MQLFLSKIKPSAKKKNTNKKNKTKNIKEKLNKISNAILKQRQRLAATQPTSSLGFIWFLGNNFGFTYLCIKTKSLHLHEMKRACKGTKINIISQKIK